MTAIADEHIRARIEILEERLVLLGGPGGAASSTFAGPIVANEAAASALPAAETPDGTQIFILSHRSIWTSNPTSTIPLKPHVIITRNGGGNLQRTTYSDPTWRIEITDVYIDPANVTGIANDENVAIFSAPQVGNARQPMLSMQELFRRWRSTNVIRTGDLINLTLNIHLISSQPLAGAADDPLIKDHISGIDTYPLILGEAPTTLLGPVALGAFTPQNPAVPAPGGTAPTITIGATVWGPFIGKRIRRISDGSIAYVLKDLGAGQARISQPQLSNIPFGSNPTNVVWAAGNSVIVESLTDVNLGNRFVWGQEASAFGFLGQYGLIDVNIMNVSGADPLWEPEIDHDDVLVFAQSTSDRSISQDAKVIVNASRLSQPFFGQGGGYGAMYGGALVGGGIPAFIAAVIFGSSKQFFAFGALDFFTYIQGGGVLVRGVGTSGTFSVWDVVVTGFNPGGHALQVGGPPNVGAGAAQFALRSSNVIFGSGSAGKGCRVAPGSKISAYLALPNITGTTGDFQLADSTVGWWWNPATGVYNPVGAGTALTWANLTAPGLFNGSAHEPQQDAHVNKAAAT